MNRSNLIQTTDPEKRSFLQGLVTQTPGSRGGAQTARLLAALSRYPITTFEAMRYLDIYHAPARVLNLRHRGVVIETRRVFVETENGVTHRIGLYVLGKKKD